MNTFLRYIIGGMLLVGSVCWIAANRSSEEDQLRQTAGIEVELLQMQRVTHGVMMEMIVTNQTTRNAVSIALTAELLADNDCVLASNPLVNVLQLSAGEKRTLSTLVPVEHSSEAMQPRLRVALVRWD
jgi:nicotinamide mononucleotide adenylyltransferase